MTTNAEIIQDTIERIVNQKKIDMWDHYFSQNYIAHGAPYIGMGFSRDTSATKHMIDYILPGSPAEGKLQIGDELLWVEDEHKRWTTFEEIEKAIQSREYKLGVRRDDQVLEVKLTRGYIKGFDTNNDQAKSDMREFITDQIPDLKAAIKLILADGDMVACFMEYRGTHAKFEREAVWRETWFTRLSEGKIVEGWPLFDEASYCRQLGYQIIPPHP